jgi:CBS domain containing-hemolysin-like protein
MGEDEYLVEGGIDIDDLNDLLDTHLPSDESDTLAGLIYAQLGRVPTVGETVPLNEKVIAHIHSLEGRRIRKVTVKRLRPDPLADDDTADKPNKSPAPTEADAPDAPHEKDHS